MTIADYLECIAAKVRRDLEGLTPAQAPVELRMFPSKERVLELFSQAHLFNLRDADGINQAGEELKEDLVDDFEAGDLGVPIFGSSPGWSIRATLWCRRQACQP